MHREYHPDELDQLHAHATGESTPSIPHHDPARELRILGLLALFLATLIALDWLGSLLALPGLRQPFGISLIWVAGVLGAARVVYTAVESLDQGRIGADIALALASIAALVIGEPFVAAEVVLIALIGEALEALAADRAMRALRHLFDNSPRTARVLRNGREELVPASEVQLGETVIIAEGERIPVDGPVLSGRSTLDTSALTGESLPVDVGPGSIVASGTLNQFGRIEVAAERVGAESTYGQLLCLVAQAQNQKAPLQRAADRYASYFLPIVVGWALVTLALGWWRGWPDLWLRAVAVLVVACPCALVLATPAAVLAATAWLARRGIILKGGESLERLARCNTLAFDKTGTLTSGQPTVDSILRLNTDLPDPELLRLAATAEQSSRHPLARAIAQAASESSLAPYTILESHSLPGAGVQATFLDPATPSAPPRSLLVGNARLLEEHGIDLADHVRSALAQLDTAGRTPLLLALDAQPIAAFGLRDTLRPEAASIVQSLRELRFDPIALLTGDRPAAAAPIAAGAGISLVESALSPEAKAQWVASRQAENRVVLMIGDGINDAPALARADVGIAIGTLGSDLAAEAGDLVTLGDPLTHLPDTVRLARATVRVIQQNILGFAFGLNIAAMLGATLGWLGPVPAAILHQAGSLLVLLNAVRLLAFRSSSPAPRLDSRFTWLDHLRHLDARHAIDLDPTPLLTWLLRHSRALVALSIVAALATYALSGLTAIPPSEVGLLLRNGRDAGLLDPGLHLLRPAPFDQVIRLQPDIARTQSIGLRSASSPSTIGWQSDHDRPARLRDEEESLALTGDGQLIELSAVVRYRIDPRPDSLRAYALRASSPDSALRPLAESVLRSVVGTSTLESLLTSGRTTAEHAATDLLQGLSNRAALGLRIEAVSLTDLHPPQPVIDSYREVSRAERYSRQRDIEAQTYKHESLARAQGESHARLNQAEAEKHRRISLAAARADAFRSLQSASASAPAIATADLATRRLLPTLSARPKVLLEPTTARRHLLLTDRLDPALSALLAPATPPSQPAPAR